jgi:dipeptidyl aminopeptidase/acylaminoacyl peptidase
MIQMSRTFLSGLALGLFSLSCVNPGSGTTSQPPCPIPGGVAADHLIQEGETHFAHLWQVTSGGENAEAYWSFSGDRLSMQVTHPNSEDSWTCDRIMVTKADGSLQQISDGQGVTTCSYFMPGDEGVIFASTKSKQATCPPRPDHSLGYVWPIHDSYEIYLHTLGGETRPLITGPGYDAEATLSPVGDRIVFTSTRSGDLELWTSDLEGNNLFQVTDEPGYDGGAFYSHDGKQLVFRTTAFTPGKEAEEAAAYKELLATGLVRPSNMELYTINVNGKERRQLTHLGKANFAPSYYPDDKKVIFASNHHDQNRPALNFDLFAIDVASGELERITTADEGRGKQFDGFPLFSPDGKYLAFSSNRGDGPAGDTNVFIALWR